MTHPPQSGQDPYDPYGGQGWQAQPPGADAPGGQTPQEQTQYLGGWQQAQGGSYAQAVGPGDPYAQAGGPGDPYAQPGGPGGPPKDRTGLWIGLGVGAVALLAVGALLFTGFVAPGFFLSDPRSVVEELAEAVSAKDADAANALLCPDKGEDALDAQDIEELKKQNITVKITGDAESISETEAKVPATVALNGLSSTGHFLVSDQDGWCVDRFQDAGAVTVPPVTTSPAVPTTSAPPTGSTGVSGSAVQAAQQFLDKINGADAGGALSTVCATSQQLVRATIDQAIKNKANLRITGTPTDSSSLVFIDLEGTTAAGTAGGNIGMSSSDNGATWCVLTFVAF